jgi:hypothetical protein
LGKGLQKFLDFDPKEEREGKMKTRGIEIRYLVLITMCCLLLPIVAYAIDNMDGAYKPDLWGTDSTIAAGSTTGGITAAYDAGGYMYAARCTTLSGVERGAINIYKSTDQGSTWSRLVNETYAAPYHTSLPQLLVKGDYLYLFYLVDDVSDGMVIMRRSGLNGLGDYHQLVVQGNPTGPDTINYFSACCAGYDTLVVVYEIHEKISGTRYQRVYSGRSVDGGNTWGDKAFLGDNAHHPDIAYAAGGKVYAVFEYGSSNWIYLKASTDYGKTWSDKPVPDDDEELKSYPKIAASHTTTPTIWVAFNSPTDIEYAYSTDGGSTWTKDQVLSSDPNNDKGVMLAMHPTNPTVYACYHAFQCFGIPTPPGYSHLYYASASTSTPGTWSGQTQINDYKANAVEDGRMSCALTFYHGGGQFIVWNKGIVYAGGSELVCYGDPANLYFDGSGFTDVEKGGDEGIEPCGFFLSVNHPNPFNPETRIEYTVQSAKMNPLHTTLSVYNVLGQQVRTLVDEPKSSGTYEVVWDGKDEKGKDVASGLYLYRLVAGNFTQTRKMILLR